MDPTSIDPKILAQQLRKPEGELGKEVGDMMAKRHVQTMEFTFRHLDLQLTDHVLEIGFGPGEAIAEAVRLTPKGFVAGIDFSQTMLEMAEERNHRAIMQEHVELSLGNAHELPFEDVSFDKVFAMNVIHFWLEPQREIAECHRVLKPGGRILFYLTHHTAWLKGLEGSGLCLAHEPNDVENILRDAGFADVHSQVETLDGRKCFVVWGAKK